MPPRESTATSLVPPPMSTIMLPRGSWIGSPVPSAAARGSSTTKASRAPAPRVASTTARFSTSVTQAGTQTTTRGWAKSRRPWLARTITCWMSRSVISKSAITPCWRGRTVSTPAGVLPIIRLASMPMARISFCPLRPVLRVANTEGSFSTTPLCST